MPSPASPHPSPASVTTSKQAHSRPAVNQIVIPRSRPVIQLQRKLPTQSRSLPPSPKVSAYSFACPKKVLELQNPITQLGTRVNSPGSVAERKDHLLALLLPGTTSPMWSQYGAISPMHKVHQRSLLQHIAHLWADNTWRGYAGIFGRMLAFAQLFSMDPQDDLTACLFIISTGAEIQGQLAYTKQLQAVMNRLQWKTVNLSMLASGLRHEGALIPLHQAAAITLPQVHELLEIVPLSLCLAVMLAWASASRWDDISRLVRGMFLQLLPHQIIINWFNQTKSSAENPYHPTMFVVIEGSFCPAICRAVTAITDPKQRITQLETTDFDKLMRRLHQPWSGHSFKKGAANAIIRACAQGLCPISILPTVLKHQQKADLVSTSIRYIDNKVDLALALGTQAATRHL